MSTTAPFSVRPALRQLFDEILASLTPESTAKSVSERLRSFHDEEWEDLVKQALEARRAEGVLKPCANAGEHGDLFLRIWDEFLAKGLPERPETLHYLLEPFNGSTVRVEFWTLAYKGVDGLVPGSNENASLPIVPEKLRAALARFEDRMVGMLDHGNTIRPVMSQFDSRVTGERFAIGMTGWQPLLGAMDYKTETFTPFPQIVTGKPILHLEVDCPTGDLLFSDGFYIEGFEEGLETLAGKRHTFGINSLAGMQAMSTAYADKADLLMIAVNNASPNIFQDGALLRLGSFDEDEFYDEDGNELGDIPQSLGVVHEDNGHCSAIDRQRLVEILVASGQHDEAGARAAIAEFEEEHDVRHATVEPGPLHLYAAGLGEIDLPEPNPFQVAGLPAFRGLEDRMVLSREPLALDPGLVREGHEPCHAEVVPYPEAKDTFYFYDGPVLFTTEVKGQVRLATYQGEEENGVHRYTLSTPTESQLAAVAANELPLRDASVAGELLLLETTDFKTARLVPMTSFPDDWLAEPGVLLSLDRTTEDAPAP